MKELARAEGVIMGMGGDLLLIFYQKTPTMEGTVAISRGFEIESDTVALLIVISSTARTPDAKVREATQKIIQRNRDRTAVMAYVVGGSGFGGAAARAAISGMLLFTRPSYPTKVFSEVAEALDWIKSQSVLGRRLDIPVGVAEVEDFCSI